MKFKIVSVGINGEGIAYDHKIPVFIPGCLDGELVEADIVETARNYKRGRLIKVLKPSKDRIEPLCPYYESCGGCSLMHCTYAKQLEIKKHNLEEALRKYADIDYDVQVIGNDEPLHYRNELKMPFGMHKGRLALGLYESSSNRFLPLDDCLIHEKKLEELKKEILKILNDFRLVSYDRRSKTGLRSLVLRTISNKAQMCLVTGKDKLDEELINRLYAIKDLVSIYQSIKINDSRDVFGKQMIHLAGSKQLEFSYGDLKLSLSSRSFYQLNSKQTKKLYALVLDKIKEETDLVVEAYCGIGTMSLLSAKKAKRVEGIEFVEDAISNARKIAKRNNIHNAFFHCGDAADILSKQFRKEKIDVLIVDPPRSGLDDNMIETILKMDIARIVYVSCNPSTLAKNLDELKRKYMIESIEAIDMFSNTSHVETVVLMQKM